MRTGANPRGVHAHAGAGDEGDETSARALKRPRLVWTPKLHQRFVEAVEQLGLKNAVPKTIMQVHPLPCGTCAWCRNSRSRLAGGFSPCA